MRPALRLFEAFEKINRRHGLIRKKDSILAAVSGGSDSMALLLFLRRIRKKYSLRIAVAHLDHGLRRGSGQDARLVRETALQCDFPFYSGKIRLKSRRKKGESLEEAGRRERYAFLEAAAGKARARKIATAHTLDDQAETVLMHLLRGAGLRGLAGIPCRRVQGKMILIRPLLACSKDDLRAFLKQAGQKYREDSSNKELSFFRNRVRHELLPQLRRKYNPRIREGLADLADACRQAQDFIRESSRKHAGKCLKSGPVVLAVDRLKKLPQSVQNEVFLSAFESLKGDAQGLGFSHLAALAEMLAQNRQNSEFSLPHGVAAARRKGKLVFTNAKGRPFR